MSFYVKFKVKYKCRSIIKKKKKEKQKKKKHY